MKGFLQSLAGAVIVICLLAVSQPVFGAGGDGKVTNSDKAEFVRGLSPWREYIYDLMDEIVDAKENYNKLIDKLNAMTSGSVAAVQWVASGQTPTFVDSDTFTVPTNMTDKFEAGRRIRAELVAGNFVYSHVTSSSFASNTTTVNVSAINLTSSLSAVSYSLIDSGSDTSIVSNMLADFDASLAPVQGDILYFNGTNWVKLAAGTSGQALETRGGSANPVWDLPGDLSVTSQAQGDILYFNGTNWVKLAAGTSGNFLKTQGASANPIWDTATAITTVRKTADETVNNSTTLQNDDVLFLAMATNETWYFTLFLEHTSTAVANLKLAFTVPAGATVNFAYYDTAIVSGSGTPATLITNGNTRGTWWRGLVLTGGTAGNLQLQWAQNTAEVSNTKVLTNSYLEAHK